MVRLWTAPKCRTEVSPNLFRYMVQHQARAVRIGIISKLSVRNSCCLFVFSSHPNGISVYKPYFCTYLLIFSVRWYIKLRKNPLIIKTCAHIFSRIWRNCIWRIIVWTICPQPLAHWPTWKYLTVTTISLNSSQTLYARYKVKNSLCVCGLKDTSTSKHSGRRRERREGRNAVHHSGLIL